MQKNQSFENWTSEYIGLVLIATLDCDEYKKQYSVLVSNFEKGVRTLTHEYVGLLLIPALVCSLAPETRQSR